MIDNSSCNHMKKQLKINGHEVTATFAMKRNVELYGRLKSLLISSAHWNEDVEDDIVNGGAAQGAEYSGALLHHN